MPPTHLFHVRLYALVCLWGCVHIQIDIGTNARSMHQSCNNQTTQTVGCLSWSASRTGFAAHCFYSLIHFSISILLWLSIVFFFIIISSLFILLEFFLSCLYDHKSPRRQLPTIHVDVCCVCIKAGNNGLFHFCLKEIFLICVTVFIFVAGFICLFVFLFQYQPICHKCK